MAYLQKLLLAGAAMGVLTASAQAETMVGRVLSASGPNSVEREGPTVALSKGSYIFEEDIIYTQSEMEVTARLDGAPGKKDHRVARSHPSTSQGGYR